MVCTSFRNAAPDDSMMLNVSRNYTVFGGWGNGVRVAGGGGGGKSSAPPTCSPELRGCLKVEVAVLGSFPSLINHMVSVDVKHHVYLGSRAPELCKSEVDVLGSRP